MGSPSAMGPICLTAVVSRSSSGGIEHSLSGCVDLRRLDRQPSRSRHEAVLLPPVLHPRRTRPRRRRRGGGRRARRRGRDPPRRGRPVQLGPQLRERDLRLSVRRGGRGPGGQRAVRRRRPAEGRRGLLRRLRGCRDRRPLPVRRPEDAARHPAARGVSVSRSRRPTRSGASGGTTATGTRSAHPRPLSARRHRRRRSWAAPPASVPPTVPCGTSPWAWAGRSRCPSSPRPRATPRWSSPCGSRTPRTTR